MKDLHTHILYGIDDGAKTLEESINILKMLKENGITDIVLTPHYEFGNTYCANNELKNKLFNLVKEKTDLNIYLGNEVRIDSHIIENIKSENISTINKTRYVLVEFSLREKNPFGKELIFNLTSNGYIPILAHPERYEYLTYDEIVEYYDMGCLLQGNITSLIGIYGNKAKKTLIKLVKNHLITVLGTDTHHNTGANITDALKKLEKITNNDEFIAITKENFDKIINDETF